MGIAFRRPQVEPLEPREVPTAFLQVIHNSPYAAAGVVDVYVNDSKLLDDFAFREATPFVAVPSGTNLKIDIVAGTAADNASPVFTTNVTLADGKNYIAAAIGDPAASDPANPQRFRLAVTDTARQAAANPANAEFLILHGSPDAPAVDVFARAVTQLTDDLEFGNFAPGGYVSVPPARPPKTTPSRKSPSPASGPRSRTRSP